MQNVVWRKALESAADPQRAKGFLDQLKGTAAGPLLKKASSEQARILVALFGGSEALSETAIAHAEWIANSLTPEALEFPRRKQGLRREFNQLTREVDSKDSAAALAILRQLKQRELLRIAVRDLARIGRVVDVTLELSDLADLCLEATFEITLRQFTERFGTPYHLDGAGNWQETGFCILGMGKLGGRELNYNSDVDLLFVYADEGHAFKEPPKGSRLAGKGLANHQFFKRLAEAFIGEVTRLTPEGALYRIDMRLRPEGNAGPLARSLPGYENYYAQWGQTWERMMLMKARCVGGSTTVAGEFMEMVQPFRYPRSPSERMLLDIAAMKRRIETEILKTGEIDRNVKLGRGGIREIEFIAQTLQLLHAGRQPFLQGSQTLPALAKLVDYGHLSASDTEALTEAYVFLRDVEHRLQMENNQQTHTIPTERRSRERLARLMGFDSLAKFEKAHRQHCTRVRELYDKVLGTGGSHESDGLPAAFEGAETQWTELLAKHSFRDPEHAYRLVQEFVNGPGYVHVSPRTTELGRNLVRKLLGYCPRKTGTPDETPVQDQPLKVLSDPDRVLARLDSFVSAYGSRAMLYELWTSNPSVFELLVLLFDRSEFLAEMAIRTPDLVDELELSGRLRRRKSAEEILEDLRHGLDDADQHLWLRRYHQAELMRLGLRDILGLADFEQNLLELSALAEACLQYSTEAVLRKRKIKTAPFAIIGMGKLGGAEIDYGSDLDIVFVADSKVRNLPQLQPIAAEILDLLSRRTEAGTVFPTDARLRPDGEKGLLVNTLNAYEDYYRNRALLWEIQALTRVRFIAGNREVGSAFEALASTLSNFKSPSLPLAAYRQDWKTEIARMRLRIEKERTPMGKDALAIKTGSGGLVDAEFIAQALCLECGWKEPHTLKALERARTERALDEEAAERLLTNYCRLRRVEGILRRWSYEGEVLLPDDPAPMYRVAVRCGFADAESFLAALQEWRRAIRSVFTLVFGQA